MVAATDHSALISRMIKRSPFLHLLRSRPQPESRETPEPPPRGALANMMRIINPTSADIAAAARAIIAAGERRRGEAADDVPRDATGAALPDGSLAARIIKAARKARGEND